MKMILFFIVLTITTLSCKKSEVTPADPDPFNKCNGRYGKDLFATVNTTANMRYGTAVNIAGNPESLLLDLYQPQGDTASKRALVIFVHGGGWTDGTKSQGRELCTFFAKKGYVTASIDYRLGIEAPVNDKTRGEAVYRGVQDIKAAVRFARANASLYKIDTTQVFIGGYSAGGVNAVHAAYGNEGEVSATIDKMRWGSLEGSGGNPASSSTVQGVFGIASAIVDLNWLQAGEPPVLCVNSKTDQVIPYNTGIDGKGIYMYGGASIVPKAASLGIPATLFTYENIAHGDYLQPTNFTTTINAVNSFLYSVVKCR